jgi:hypothetical protein
MKSTSSVLAALTFSLAAGCAPPDADVREGGKADNLGAGDNATDALFYRGQGGSISDPGCQNCDAVGFGRGTIEVEAPLAGHLFYRATIRHPNPKDLSASLWYNTNHSFDEFSTMGSWHEDLTSGEIDSDPLVHAIRKLESTDGCTTTSEFPDCYEVVLTGDLGMQDVIGFKFEKDEVARAVFDLDIMDLGLNGATGTIIETQLVIDQPAFFM